MLPRLYVITDRAAAKRGCGSVVDACIAAAEAGARLFQIRDHVSTPRRCYADAEEIVTQLAGYGARVLVNDRADIAFALACDGVHRSQIGIPMRAIRRVIEQRLVAVSCHDAKELLEADADHAAFATFGPVFETASKPDAKLVGLAGLSAASKLAQMPIYALGGVSPDNAAQCLSHGAWGIAVMSGIMAAADPYAATRAYLEALPADLGG